MEMNGVDGMEMNCVICGRKDGAMFYDLPLPGDKVIVARSALR